MGRNFIEIDIFSQVVKQHFSYFFIFSNGEYITNLKYIDKI